MANFADVQHCIFADIHNRLVGQKRPKLCLRDIGMVPYLSRYYISRSGALHFVCKAHLKKNFTNKVELDDHCILTQG